MVNTMRPCLFLAAIVLGAAQTPGPQAAPSNGAWCAINGIGAADQLTNSIIFIWQGINRCGDVVDADTHLILKEHNKAECSVDVSYAIQAVQNTINLIMKAVAGCTGALDQNGACGLAVGEVTSALAGVAGAGSSIAENCPKTSLKPVKGLGGAMSGTSSDEGKFPHGLAMCIVDAKALLWSVIGVSVHMTDAHEQCKVQSDGCTRSILHVTSAVAQMGEFIAGVVGHCSKPESKLDIHAAKCAGDILGLLRNLNQLGQAGAAQGRACALTSGQRLYLENDGKKKVTQMGKDNLPMLGLAMLLPLTAVMSFVAGRRMAKARQMPAYDAEAAEE